MTPTEDLILELRNEEDARQRDRMTECLSRWRANADIIDRLKLCGLWPESCNDTKWHLRHGRITEVAASDLPTLRTVFPKVQNIGIYHVHDANEGTVKVWLDLGVGDVNDSRCICCYYAKQLPADSRCKIVTEMVPSSTVVCGV